MPKSKTETIALREELARQAAAIFSLAQACTLLDAPVELRRAWIATRRNLEARSLEIIDQLNAPAEASA